MRLLFFQTNYIPGCFSQAACHLPSVYPGAVIGVHRLYILFPGTVDRFQITAFHNDMLQKFIAFKASDVRGQRNIFL